jgi:ABC-2 type transport system permease protein
MMYETLVPSYTVMFVFFLVNIMARSFIAERDLGTLRRLRLAPISPLGILIGKNVPFYCLSLVQTVLLFLGGRLIFGMSWGSEPWLLIPVIVCTSLAATALGLMVSTFIRTDSQVSAYGNSLVILLAGISGCFMPRKWLPLLMQKISLGTPHAWALLAYDEILSKEHVLVAEIAKSCVALLGFAAVFFIVGWLRFRADAE